MPSGSTIRRTGNPRRLAGELAHLLVTARGDRTRQALAEAAGVHPNTLGELEKGRGNPTLAYLEAIGPVYGITISLGRRVRPVSAHGPTCTGCGARIIWRRNENTGRVAPIDADPTRDGNVVIVDAEFYRILPPGQGSAGQPRHLNHFVTCTRPPVKGARR